jgi:hypothetical protein
VSADDLREFLDQWRRDNPDQARRACVLCLGDVDRRPLTTEDLPLIAKAVADELEERAEARRVEQAKEAAGECDECGILLKIGHMRTCSKKWEHRP